VCSDNINKIIADINKFKTLVDSFYAIFFILVFWVVRGTDFFYCCVWLPWHYVRKLLMAFCMLVARQRRNRKCRRLS